MINANDLHQLFQELEDQKIKLPFGDYQDVYLYLENLREREGE